MKHNTLSQNAIVFAVFFTLFLVKNLLFQWFAFYEWLPFEPSFVAWLGFLLPKVASAIFFASVVFLLRDKRWMVILAIVVDVWCFANLIYMRNNNFLLDSFAFSIAGNLNGYWWSVLVFVELVVDLGLLVISGLAFSVFHWIKKTQRAFTLFFIAMVCAIGLHYLGELCYIQGRAKNERPAFCWNVYSREARERVYGIDYEYLVEQTSLLTMPFYLLPDHIEIKSHKVYNRSMSAADCAKADSLMQDNRQEQLDTPLILVICESLENWVCKPEIMPHLSALTAQEHVLYADHVTTQIIGAPSADGQMIVNTGILPLTEGYTCFRYPQNEYPALMKLFADSTVLILPHDISVWNQTMMSPAYGYDTTVMWSDVDTALFEKLNEVQRSGIQHIQCITQSTHAPFVSCAMSSLEMPDDMPFFMSRFIRAFNVLDEGLGKFVDRIKSDSVLQQYTIVITGDHHILYKEKRQRYARYAHRSGLDLHPKEAFLPLIIYSPAIEGNIHLTDTCYQMDIFPTILHLIGAENYYWKGFGVDIMDSTALRNRKVSPNEAFRLSDLMIRNNAFKEE